MSHKPEKIRIPLPKKTEKVHEDKTRYHRKPKHPKKAREKFLHDEPDSRSDRVSGEE